MMHQHLHAVAPSPAMTAAIGPLDTDAAASEPPLNGHAAQPDVEQPAEETQKPPAEDGGALSVEAPEPEFKIPKMSYFETLKLFLKFGCLAVGGPVQQIAMVKEELVTKQKWISPAEFNKVFAVYQALPGPEATELCCYFGQISNGRIGGLIGGLAFCAPGFCIMLLFSYLYKEFALFESPGFLASFHAVRPCVPAMCVRAVFKISEHALVDHSTGSPDMSSMLILLSALGMLLTLFGTPFFVTLGFSGIVHILYKRVHWAAAYALFALGIIGNIIYIALEGLPTTLALAAGSQTDTVPGTVFVTGLLAGCVTFGGAFTAVPYVFRSLVTLSHLMTPQQFLDGIAVVNFVPTPLVMFVTWDGFMADGIRGAILMTIGMFIPCFSMVLFGHEAFMWLTQNRAFSSFLDGVSASVIGLIAETACQLTLVAVHTGMDTLVFTCTLLVLNTSKNKNAPLMVICAAAMAGQVLYRNGANQVA